SEASHLDARACVEGVDISENFDQEEGYVAAGSHVEALRPDRTPVPDDEARILPHGGHVADQPGPRHRCNYTRTSIYWLSHPHHPTSGDVCDRRRWNDNGRTIRNAVIDRSRKQVVTLIGFDDTDSRERGMCTTYLAAQIAARIRDAGGQVSRIVLVRLNPAIEYKTRGNAALCVHTDLAADESFAIAHDRIDSL